MCFTARMSSSFEDPPGPDQQPGTPSAPPPGYYPPPPGPGYQQPQSQPFQYAAGPPASAAGGPPKEALAGFWQRFGGAVVDGILLAVVSSLLSIPFGDAPGFSTSADFIRMAQAGGIIGLVLGAAYFTYFHSTAAGQTLGNRLVGTRILDASSGGSLPYARSLIRYLVASAGSIVGLVSAGAGSAVSLLVLVGFLWMIWDPRKQTFHDKAANSLVVRATAYPPGSFGRPAA